MEESRTTETNTTSTIKLDGSTSKLVDKGQGELYSPDYAINVNKETTKQGQDKKEEQEIPEGTSGMGLVEASKGVAADITRRNFGAVKERLIENLAAAAVPADALDKTRQFLETFVRDVTLAAQGVTKDAILRIKTHLVDILPSLSPAITRKVRRSISTSTPFANYLSLLFQFFAGFA